MREEELLLKLREAFQVEAGERLSSIFANLEVFEKALEASARKPLIEVLFREAHSLKGAARAVNSNVVETLCQALETVFSLLKEHNPQPQSALLDLLYDSATMLEKVIVDPEIIAQDPGKEEFVSLLDRLAKVEQDGLEFLLVEPESIESVQAGELLQQSVAEPASADSVPADSVPADSVTLPLSEGPASTPLVAGTSGAETLRIATFKLDELMLVAEEFTSLKLALRQHLSLLHATLNNFSGWEKEWGAIKAEIPQLGRGQESSEKWSKVAGFFETNQNLVKSLERQLRDLGSRMDSDWRIQAGLVNDLLERVRDIALLPIETLFAPMSRMVRELARELGKNVEFEFSGGAIEVDRRVLEEMKDPVIHLLRNAVDHGLESPQDRDVAGKVRAGRILCTVLQSDSSSIDITIVDDGQGIDCQKLKQKAVAMGLLTSQVAASMAEENLLDLIFNSGFSTSAMITEISGRGLGMAIVREKIENLGGRIVVSTKLGGGTTFTIHLPVSIAVCRGIRVDVAGREFVFPSLKVERVLRIEKNLLRTVEGLTTVVSQKRVLPVRDLATLLGLQRKVERSQKNRTELSLVIIGSGNRCQALVVDDVLGEQEILVKGLGKQLVRVPLIAGATILGSGRVVPIINVKDILENSSSNSSADLIPDLGSGDSAIGDDRERGDGYRLLVVDDSMTSRMLLQNILEAADYLVTTAVDGVAALTLLKSEVFDLVVSDVEMPRMDGFSLTENIRDDKHLAEIPVILVTSLGSREDRERGVAVGADAYIVKGEFDQNNLLKIIERLL